ncbi:hypothetical protein pipiens_017655 [Culex pipiens pipiens]|uniref:Uncharacterized protein n=1 Tax=Culex pipiens pipiens TaxID=38569 RepID=A0ABD1CFK3_CULPP
MKLLSISIVFCLIDLRFIVENLRYNDTSIPDYGISELQQLSACPTRFLSSGIVRFWTPDNCGHSPFNAPPGNYPVVKSLDCYHMIMSCQPRSVRFVILNCCFQNPPDPVGLPNHVTNHSWTMEHFWYSHESMVTIVYGVLSHVDGSKSRGLLVAEPNVSPVVMAMLALAIMVSCVVTAIALGYFVSAE